jgi:spore germination protein GerM
MKTKYAVILFGLFSLFVLLLILFFSGGGEEIREPQAQETEIPEQTEEESRESRTVQLFFLSEDDNRLHPEEREIWADVSRIYQIRQTLTELLEGPREEGISPFPLGTELREVYITPRGVAFVDFSRELENEHPSGSAAEIATVFSIVNSITYNFDSVKSVFILVNGGERETLAGHVDLRKPLLPRFDLIAKK